MSVYLMNFKFGEVQYYVCIKKLKGEMPIQSNASRTTFASGVICCDCLADFLSCRKTRLVCKLLNLYIGEAKCFKGNQDISYSILKL